MAFFNDAAHASKGSLALVISLTALNSSHKRKINEETNTWISARKKHTSRLTQVKANRAPLSSQWCDREPRSVQVNLYTCVLYNLPPVVELFFQPTSVSSYDFNVAWHALRSVMIGDLVPIRFPLREVALADIKLYYLFSLFRHIFLIFLEQRHSINNSGTFLPA